MAPPEPTAPATELELHIGEIRQLFNSMDPAPFRERDLDPNARDFIVGWGEETPAGAPLSLVVRLSRESASPEDAALVADAVHSDFRQRALATRQQLRQLLRTGRISLLIGLAFLAAAIGVGEFVANLVSRVSYGVFIRESFVIGGWVALWRPLEILLYEWWPIRAQAQLYDRLGTMRVTVCGAPVIGEPRA